MQYVHSAREYLSPLLKESNFKKTGLLTTNEFVQTGDYLVSKCPSWSWVSGNNSKLKTYLPVDKQYLVSRNIPCLYRIEKLDSIYQETVNTGNEEWTNINDSSKTNEPIKDIDSISNLSKEPSDQNPFLNQIYSNDSSCIDYQKKKNLEELEQELEDEDFEIYGIEDDLAVLQNDNIIRTRTYDISITYDKYYQTPRVWLTGYDEYRSFLSSKEIYQDISPEHANKTVTIERHPHESITTVSIHPCQHANVMRVLIEGSPNKESITIDQYMFIFLKFIQTILPSMDYEFISYF